MKTLLYNPIFINPQAYYVFPRLTRYLQPDNESTSEPANYIGTIEVKVIAYGDTTLKRTYTNTDSIDLSEFKNTWIRISLFTKVGSCVLGEWKIGNMESDLPYIDPEVLASLKAVVIVGNKTNNDSDRAIVKNLVDPDNPFVIGNAAFKLNSGFGEYEQDFTDWKKSPKVTSFDSESIKFTSDVSWVLLYHPSSIGEDIPSFKVRVKLYGKGTLYYSYITQEGKYTNVAVKSEIFETPICYNTKYTGEKGVNVGFTLGVTSGECSGTITQIPSFEGAFVTDGIDDLITSTKTVQEMLGGSNEITVVSMIHQIGLGCRTNFICDKGSYWRCNEVANTGEGKTGIYGYSSTNISVNTPNIINNVLGDKVDYSVTGDRNDLTPSQFSVVGYISSSGKISYTSSVAWYWTIIANKVLTTDEINQVIAYYNLDRTLKPDILCNTIKQGITNENHAEFGDKLIDFSGNGRDIQLNNIAWKGDSGIGKYNFSNINIIANRFEGTVTTNKCHFTKKLINTTSNFCDLIVISPNEPIKFKVSGLSDGRKLFVANKSGSGSNYNFDNGEHEVSLSFAEGVGQNNPFGVTGDIGDIDVTVEFIPSHAGALCLDGVSDFGKVTGMPIYKDYTVVADRELFNAIGCVLSNDNPGAFIFETSSASVYSFGEATTSLTIPTDKQIRYQTKYSYNGQNISIGAVKEGTSNMWLGTIRDNDARFRSAAIYSLMTFPYSMSEFLIERQLKKHKLGTLYPDMVEFRPIVTYDKDLISKLKYFYIPKYANWVSISPGDYLPNNAEISFTVDLRYPVDEVSSNLVFSNLENVRVVKSSGSGNSFDIRAYVTNKSPQKINITIDEYIRYEDIVQPYPVLLRFKDENGNEVSWGGKFKVGSTITRIGSAADSNLLPNIYNIFGLLLNGNQVTSSKVIVEKTMVFKAKSAYIFDNNEPKCILSPSRLRIPNSSYKLLGYIPDISGHGNHGVIHNSAYAEGSGVNEDGSYQFDGVDDFVTIPTLSSGGKQVLMKVNWNTINSIIYDQRGSGGFAIYCSDYNTEGDSITVPAYKGRNAAGTTYIDGIRNEYIIASQLRNVTHNIVEILDTSYAAGKTNPIIGKSHMNSNYGNLALYDFMLFDDISTDDKIKELNEYVGIEAKVELPPYYWDAYGKTNLDADKATIQQRGVAVGDYDLTNNNHAYDKMSGYGGYKFAKFDNTIEWFAEDSSMVVNRNGYLITLKKVPNVAFWRFRNTTLKSLDNPLTFKVKCNKPIDVIFQVKFAKNNDVSIGYNYNIKEVTLVPNESTTIIVPSVSVSDIPEATSILFINVLFNNTSLSDNEEYTVEMLPLYPNGLVYDAITDYSENVNIPVFTDFTAIMKRKWLKNQGCPLIKGSKVYEGGNGNALLFEWDKAYNFVFYKRTDIMEGKVPENISFITPTNYNGNVITRGSEQDTNGICIAGDGNAGFANMVFYKLILYPKTIPLLQINFLKNLMEKDEIIDLNNKIFIQE